MVANHLSRFSFDKDELPIKNSFPDKQLFFVKVTPWFTDKVNFLVACEIPQQWSSQDEHKLLYEIRQFFYDDPY